MVFLSREEAFEAIQRDLLQYSPQTILLRRLAQLILGLENVLAEDAKRTSLWIKTKEKGKPRLVPYDKLAKLLLLELEGLKPPLRVLAEICGCVFQEKAWVGIRSHDGVSGIYVETGIENFKCRRCGRCCLELDYHKELTDEDYELWRKLGRLDIMERVRVVRKKSEIVAYRIWMDPVTKKISEKCPWLRKDSEHNRYMCLIHDVRPKICRQYPGSRKHSRMTGCPGMED
jgi:Fe-S-cluster containining protein